MTVILPTAAEAFLSSITRPLRRFRRLTGVAALALGVFLISLQTLVAHEFEIGALKIGHPFARAAPPGAKVIGGYLAVRNTGKESDRLVGVSAEIAGRVEIHEMAVKDGVMSMRPITGGLEIPAAGEVILAPGKLHLMFLDITRSPKEGERC
jgi:periplasmic copper chaperone A